MPEDPTISAGEMDKRVTLLQPVYGQYEEEIADWAAVSDVWAAIDPTAGREADVSGKTTAVTDMVLVIRYRADIDKRWRVMYRDRLFRITAIRNVATRNVRMVIDCQEVQ